MRHVTVRIPLLNTENDLNKGLNNRHDGYKTSRSTTTINWLELLGPPHAKVLTLPTTNVI